MLPAPTGLPAAVWRFPARLRGSLHFVSHASWRRYDSKSFCNYNRNVTDASIGIGFAPGDIPLRVW